MCVNQTNYVCPKVSSISLHSFFSSYQITDSGWSYIFGQFAQLSHPTTDEVTLTVQRIGSSESETFTVRPWLHPISQFCSWSFCRYHIVRRLAQVQCPLRTVLHSKKTTVLPLMVQMGSMHTRQVIRFPKNGHHPHEHLDASALSINGASLFQN